MRRDGAGEGEGGVDSHHFGVHRQWYVGAMAAAASRDVRLRRLVGRKMRFLGRRLLLLLLARLTFLLFLKLQSSDIVGVTKARRELTSFKCAPIETRTIVIVPFTDDLTSVDDDGSMSVIQ